MPDVTYVNAGINPHQHDDHSSYTPWTFWELIWLIVSPYHGTSRPF
jgi:hypothetical protein